MLEEFGKISRNGGSGVVIASQSGHRFPSLMPEQDKARATNPKEELLSLPFLQTDAADNSLFAYQLSKRGNSLCVNAEAVNWCKRRARINNVSSGNYYDILMEK